MSAISDTLVLMACSGEKSPGERQAWDLYRGPLWQTLRTHAGQLPRENVCVLSAGYGFINARTRIEPYDALLSAHKAQHLIARGVHGRNDRFGQLDARNGTTGCSPWVEAGATSRVEVSELGPYRYVLIAASGHYADVLHVFADDFKLHGLVDVDAPVLRTRGAIGMQRKELGDWLRRLNRDEVDQLPADAYVQELSGA